MQFYLARFLCPAVPIQVSPSSSIYPGLHIKFHPFTFKSWLPFHTSSVTFLFFTTIIVHPILTFGFPTASQELLFQFTSSLLSNKVCIIHFFFLPSKFLKRRRTPIYLISKTSQRKIYLCCSNNFSSIKSPDVIKMSKKWLHLAKCQVSTLKLTQSTQIWSKFTPMEIENPIWLQHHQRVLAWF